MFPLRGGERERVGGGERERKEKLQFPIPVYETLNAN